MSNVIHAKFGNSAKELVAPEEKDWDIAVECPLKYVRLAATACHILGNHLVADALDNKCREQKYAEWIQVRGELRRVVETVDLALAMPDMR
jgi:hypothetical protein